MGTEKAKRTITGEQAFDRPFSVDKEKTGEQQSWDRMSNEDRCRIVVAEMAQDIRLDYYRKGIEKTFEECHREAVKIAQHRDLAKRKKAA